MSEKERKTLVRGFLTALEERDLEKALSLVTEDVVWTTPAGTYRGKEALRRYLAWEFEMVPSLTVTETGVGLLVEGDQALIEHRLAGRVRGEPCEWLGMCAYEFADGKLQAVRSVYDRLSLVQDSATGWLERMIVDLVASQAESGLR
jgi:ketosteroid isomerase-like protein